MVPGPRPSPAAMGEWIRHGAWDHENWGGELPSRTWVDAMTPDNPVWIYRLDGHMAIANSLALHLAGVDADTPDVDGGAIVRGAGDRPTGILKDNAMSLVESVAPVSSKALLDREAAAAMAYLASNGVTSAHDMAGFESMATYRQRAGKQYADDAPVFCCAVIAMGTFTRRSDQQCLPILYCWIVI